MTTLIATGSAVLGFAVLLFAIKRVHDPVVGFLGVMMMLVPLLVLRGVHAQDAQERTVDTLEARYGVSIDEYVLSETPSRWRIDGDYYTCYLDDLGEPAKDLDLRCAANNATFTTMGSAH